MENNFSIIISTCDKFSDLWDAHILLLNQNWADRNVETFLVTDKPTDRTFENVTVVAAGEGTEITERLRAVMPLIKTEYVPVLLSSPQQASFGEEWLPAGPSRPGQRAAGLQRL